MKRLEMPDIFGVFANVEEVKELSFLRLKTEDAENFLAIFSNHKKNKMRIIYLLFLISSKEMGLGCYRSWVG